MSCNQYITVAQPDGQLIAGVADDALMLFNEQMASAGENNARIIPGYSDGKKLIFKHLKTPYAFYAEGDRE